MMTFGGVIPILATPFHQDEALDLESWEQLLEFMVGLGVDGITILGVLGESNRLTDRERETLIKNATRLGNAAVAEAAFRKRISLVPAERPGSVEHDFWQMVQAFEFTLSEERGKNTRLFRTRQKVAKAGVVQTLRDWAVGSQETAGFKMLLERGMPEFTGEAITLRHPEHFEPPVLEAAQQRLTAAGVDLSSLR